MKQIKSRTRILAWMLTILMVLTMMPAAVTAEPLLSPIVGSGYSFDAYTGTLIVSSNDGTENWYMDGVINENDVKTVQIENTVTEIADYAFAMCTTLEAVDFMSESTLTTIDEGAFFQCTGLASITIPVSVKTISDGAFGWCKALETVTFAEGSELTIIEWAAFAECTSLRDIQIPASVTTIGWHAFSGCVALETVDFADESKLIIISERAFQGCSSLKDIIIPASVDVIDGYAFEDCISLATVAFKPRSQLTIIGECAFYGCENIKGIVVPASVTTIGLHAFSDCTALQTVIFAAESKLTTIDDGAFWGCTSLTDITLPASITSIDGSAFVGCTNLSGLTISGDDAPFVIEGNILYNKDKSVLIMYYLADNASSFKIPDTVTRIGNYAFSGCTNLETVTFSNESKLTTIAEGAFQKCTSLLEIQIPGSVGTIESDAFWGCTDLQTVTFTEGSKLTALDWWVFRGCSSLTDIFIPALVTEIRPIAFEGCTNLATVTFAEGSKLTIIEWDAFKGCSSLADVRIPASVTKIGSAAFSGCGVLHLKFLGRFAPTTLGASFAGENADSIAEVLYPTAWSAADVEKLTNSLGNHFDGQVTPYKADFGSSSRPSTPTPEIQTDGGTVTASVTVQPTSTAGGLDLTLPAGPVGQAIDQALEQIGESGDRVEVDIYAAGGRNAAGLQATLPSSVLDAAIDKGVDALNILTDGIRLSFDAGTLETLSDRSGGEDVTIALRKTPHEELSDEQRRSVSDDSLIFTVNTTTPSGRIDGAGVSIGVSVPYTLRDGQSPDSIVVCYVDNAGNITKVPTSYDAGTGMLTFTIPHLSVYAVFDTWVADALNKEFADVSATDWFYGDVKYAYINKLFTGTSETAFSPNQGMTRGMFATVLYRLAGEPVYSEVSAFKDIPENEYYAIPVAWAAAQNLVTGYSDERFGPNDPVTREQMALILMNYALSTGLDVSAAADLSAFADAESVSDWAGRAVSWANAAGLLNGSGGKLMPAGNATRAEVAAVLHRFALSSTR